MVWARLDDAILDNPKIARVGLFGFALHVAAITWCARNLTDGFIPYQRAACLFDMSSAKTECIFAASSPKAMGDRAFNALEDVTVHAEGFIANLVAVGLWAEDEERGGWWLKDFLVYNPSRESVLKQRESGKDRAKKSHEKRVKAPNPSRASSGEDTAKTPRSFGVTSPSPGPDPDPVPEEITQVKPVVDLDPRSRGLRLVAEASSARPTSSDIPDGFETTFAGLVESVRMATGGRPTLPTAELWADFADWVRRKGVTSSDWSAEARSWLRKGAQFEKRDAARDAARGATKPAGKHVQPTDMTAPWMQPGYGETLGKTGGDQ